MKLNNDGPLGFMRAEDCKYFEKTWKLRELEEEMERRRKEREEVPGEPDEEEPDEEEPEE